MIEVKFNWALSDREREAFEAIGRRFEEQVETFRCKLHDLPPGRIRLVQEGGELYARVEACCESFTQQLETLMNLQTWS
jgi:hypothetical protein